MPPWACHIALPYEPGRERESGAARQPAPGACTLVACRTWIRSELIHGAARDWGAEGAGSALTDAGGARPCRGVGCGALGVGVKTRGGRMSGAQIQAKEPIIALAIRSLLSPRFHTPPTHSRPSRCRPPLDLVPCTTKCSTTMSSACRPTGLPSCTSIGKRSAPSSHPRDPQRLAICHRPPY